MKSTKVRRPRRPCTLSALVSEFLVLLYYEELNTGSIPSFEGKYRLSVLIKTELLAELN